MQFSPASLRSFLDSSFSGRTTALTELLQNCRRAGATRIDIRYEDDVLTFVDNGCGIADLAHLLTPGTSGWDEKVMAEDKPFGLGFRAALLNCDYVAVSSKFGCFGSDTDALLNGQAPVIESCDCDTTAISLHHPKIPRLAEALKQSARYFPIPVTFNGEHINSWNMLVLADNDDWTLKYVADSNGCGRLACLVQGLPVTMPDVFDKNGGTTSPVRPFQLVGRSSYDRCANYVLEFKRLEARVPDRESLRNPEDYQQLDLTSVLLAYVADHYRTQTEVCRDIANHFSAVMKLVNEQFGDYYDYITEPYEYYPQVSHDTNVSRRRVWTRQHEPNLRALGVGDYTGDDEDNMVAMSWLNETEPGEDYLVASPYACPVPQDLELRWMVKGEVEANIVASGRLELNLCSGPIVIQPQYVDDDEVVRSDFCEIEVSEVFEATEGIIWLSPDGNLYTVARQMERHLNEEGHTYDFNEDEVEEFVRNMTALIETHRNPEGALMKLAQMGDGYLPSSVVRATEPARNRCYPLLDQDENVVKEGVDAFLLRYPSLRNYLKEVLKDEQAQTQAAADPEGQ